MFRVLTRARNCKFNVRVSRQPALWRSLSSGADGLKDPNTTPPPLPLYKAKVGESVEVKKARLLYQSRKRGIAENGLLLSTFAAEHLKHLSETQLDQYDVIINQPSNDWDIYYWMIGHKPTPAEYDNPVMDLLKEHAKNKNNESRIVQPAL